MDLALAQSSWLFAGAGALSVRVVGDHRPSFAKLSCRVAPLMVKVFAPRTLTAA
jgi:hypothetical protein